MPLILNSLSSVHFHVHRTLCHYRLFPFLLWLFFFRLVPRFFNAVSTRARVAVVVATSTRHLHPLFNSKAWPDQKLFFSFLQFSKKKMLLLLLIRVEDWVEKQICHTQITLLFTCRLQHHHVRYGEEPCLTFSVVSMPLSTYVLHKCILFVGAFPVSSFCFGFFRHSKGVMVLNFDRTIL